MAHASSPAAPHPAPPSSHLLAPLVSLALSPSHPHPRSKRTHALADSHSIPRTRTTPPDPARAAANPWHSTPVPPGALMLIGQPNPQRQPGHPQTKVWTAPPGRVGSLERWRLWWGAGVTPVSMLEWVSRVPHRPPVSSVVGNDGGFSGYGARRIAETRTDPCSPHLSSCAVGSSPLQCVSSTLFDRRKTALTYPSYAQTRSSSSSSRSSTSASPTSPRTSPSSPAARGTTFRAPKSSRRAQAFDGLSESPSFPRPSLFVDTSFWVSSSPFGSPSRFLPFLPLYLGSGFYFSIVVKARRNTFPLSPLAVSLSVPLSPL